MLFALEEALFPNRIGRIVKEEKREQEMAG